MYRKIFLFIFVSLFAVSPLWAEITGISAIKNEKEMMVFGSAHQLQVVMDRPLHTIVRIFRIGGEDRRMEWLSMSGVSQNESIQVKPLNYQKTNECYLVVTITPFKNNFTPINLIFRKPHNSICQRGFTCPIYTQNAVYFLRINF